MATIKVCEQKKPIRHFTPEQLQEAGLGNLKDMRLWTLAIRRHDSDDAPICMGVVCVDKTGYGDLCVKLVMPICVDPTDFMHPALDGTEIIFNAVKGWQLVCYDALGRTFQKPIDVELMK